MHLLQCELEKYAFYIEYVKRIDRYCGGFYEESEFGWLGCGDPFWFDGAITIKQCVTIISCMHEANKHYGDPRYFDKKGDPIITKQNLGVNYGTN
ncbi:MAG: hypothetical protein ACTSQE_16285 [Candidatus Heimdallarchaeaceae archaeon]